jgi:protein-S-isoprenylcysteine O-methyltransferase Ste14
VKKSSKEYILVMMQLLLFTLYIWNPLQTSMHQNSIINYVALFLVIIGLITIASAIYALRMSISAFPSPTSNAKLINTGVFKLVRHPIYSSILISSFGWALYSNSLFRILIFVALFLLFEIKSNFEEQLLIKKFPNYHAYKKNTGKYFPKLK